MANRRSDPRRKKQWVARVRHDGVRVFLGYFATKEEAVEAEEEYKMIYKQPTERAAS